MQPISNIRSCIAQTIEECSMHQLPKKRQQPTEVMRGLASHRVMKLYYRVAPDEWFEKYMPIFGDLRMNIDGQERRALGWVNWAITTRVDTSAHWLRVCDAVAASQL